MTRRHVGTAIAESLAAHGTSWHSSCLGKASCLSWMGCITHP